MLKNLAAKCPENYFFYFNISFEETLKRHSTKSNAHEFGEKEMREWYKLNDLTHFKAEEIIPESLSLEEAVNTILHRAAL
jgi:hypothetical protein